jgi:hypothetical protein
MKPCAYNLIRSEPHYRREAFTAGLKKNGFDVREQLPLTINAGDLLLIWNRYYTNHDLAQRFERAGGIVIVAENGYLAPGGGSPVHLTPRHIYAVARSAHNDHTTVRSIGVKRFEALGVREMPWRSNGNHILIAPNRSFGTPGRMMPTDWASDMRKKLEKLTKREIRVRPHPGNDLPKKPLADDLRSCWATVIWATSAGVQSLLAGIPVICEAPFWICKTATVTLDELIKRSASAPIEAIDAPNLGANRLPALQLMACAQWDITEIESGVCFDHLLHAD